MTTTFQHTGTFIVETCCNCGIQFGVPEDFYGLCRASTEKWFFCPNGHRQHYAQSEETRLRSLLDTQKRNTDFWQRRAREEEAEVRRQRQRAGGFKGQLAKTKKRIAAGVCPCCGRTFRDLARHMTAKHPGYGVDAVPEVEP